MFTYTIVEIQKIIKGCLNDWFNYKNENHPHKGLKLKSPRECMREAAETF